MSGSSDASVVFAPSNSIAFQRKVYLIKKQTITYKTNKKGNTKMKPEITGIHHIALKAKGLENYKQLFDFYTKILGLPVVRTWGSDENPAAMIDTGAGMLEIFANAPDALSAGALRHMAFAVKDTDAAIEAVRAAGYKVTMEPTDIVIASEIPYPARIAFCIGPVGEEVEFFMEK